MTGKTAFVTGASGFIGVNLVKQLGEAGWSVIAMHRETSDLTYLGQFPATRVVGDIGDRDFLVDAIPEGVDALFHVAGNVSFDSAGDEAQTHANVAGTRAVVEVAMAKNVGRFIQDLNRRGLGPARRHAHRRDGAVERPRAPGQLLPHQEDGRGYRAGGCGRRPRCRLHQSR